MLSFSKPVPPQMNPASVHRLPIHRHRLSRPELRLTPTHLSIPQITLLTHCPWSVGSHQDPRPHKCKVPRCPKAYAKASSLDKHIKAGHSPKHDDSHTAEHGDHQDNQQADSLHYSQRSENDDHQDPRPYKYTVSNCHSNGFSKLMALGKHTKTIHEAWQAGQDAQRVRNCEEGEDDEFQLDPCPFKCTVLNCRSAEGFKTSAYLN